jgi:hypothetical protein
VSGRVWFVVGWVLLPVFMLMWMLQTDKETTDE